jgi:hypothetical protein
MVLLWQNPVDYVMLLVRQGDRQAEIEVITLQNLILVAPKEGRNKIDNLQIYWLCRLFLYPGDEVKFPQNQIIMV